jgi:hypothetical protein
LMPAFAGMTTTTPPLASPVLPMSPLQPKVCCRR